MFRKLAISFFLVVVLILLIFPLRLEGFIIEKDVRVTDTLLYHSEEIQYTANAVITSGENNKNSIGISIDTDKMDFGHIPTGGSYGTRFINVSNMNSENVKVKLGASGNISSMIEFEENGMILTAGEVRLIPVHLKTTESTQVGNYSGKIKVSTIKSKNNIADIILQWL